MVDLPSPTVDEVEKCLLSTVKHVLNVEYFLKELEIGREDPERPHDIVGSGNKFEWRVIRGLAIQGREFTPAYFDTHIFPSINIHRLQYHHRKWNMPNPNSTDDDMKLGAVDTICSLREIDREYKGDVPSYGVIGDKAISNPAHKTPWIEQLIPEMEKIKQPDLHLVVSLNNIPNLGIEPEYYDALVGRVQETIILLKEEHGLTI